MSVPTLKEFLSRVSKIQSKEIDLILEKVFENQKLLRQCGGPHRFEVSEHLGALPRRYRCSLCGGEVSAEAQTWYAEGLEHGRRP